MAPWRDSHEIPKDEARAIFGGCRNGSGQRTAQLTSAVNRSKTARSGTAKEKTMIIGRFRRENDGFIGPLTTLGIQLNDVRFAHRDKGANYAILGPEDCELGAAWLKSGDFGDYLSVRLDSPTLPAPINATMKLTPSEDGVYALRWQRREPPRSHGDGKHGGGDYESP
jgi:uncharacterized protein (DUF736 family)